MNIAQCKNEAYSVKMKHTLRKMNKNMKHNEAYTGEIM
jgi:hypothetical protein